MTFTGSIADHVHDTALAAVWTWFPSVVLVSLGILFFCFYYPYHRQQRLKALAERRHLEWLGFALPPDFPCEMLSDLGERYHHRYLRKTENVMSGMEDGDRLLAFDGLSSNGSGRFVRTWVARRVSSSSRQQDVSKSMIYREDGAWRAIARKSPFVFRRTMNAATIEKMWQRLS